VHRGEVVFAKGTSIVGRKKNGGQPARFCLALGRNTVACRVGREKRSQPIGKEKRMELGVKEKKRIRVRRHVSIKQPAGGRVETKWQDGTIFRYRGKETLRRNTV